MTIYLVTKYTRDGSMGTTDENVYETLKAFTSKKSAEDYMDLIVNEYNEEHKIDGKKYEKNEFGYRRITYAGSSIEDDVDYKELYIEELEVEES